jgi:hypothetical protein
MEQKIIKNSIVSNRSLTQNSRNIVYQICHNCTRGLIIIVIIVVVIIIVKQVLWKVLMCTYETFNMRNDITCTIHCNYRIVATLQ